MNKPEKKAHSPSQSEPQKQTHTGTHHRNQTAPEIKSRPKSESPHQSQHRTEHQSRPRSEHESRPKSESSHQSQHRTEHQSRPRSDHETRPKSESPHQSQHRTEHQSRPRPDHQSHPKSDSPQQSHPQSRQQTRPQSREHPQPFSKRNEAETLKSGQAASNTSSLSENSETEPGSDSALVSGNDNKLSRFCFEGDYAAPSASGRIIRELILAARGLEMPLALSEHRSYGPEAAKVLCSEIIRRIAKRPSSGRLRIFCLPAAALPPNAERGIFFAISGFHPTQISTIESQKLKRAKKIWVYSKKHLDTLLKFGFNSEKVELFEPTVNSRIFSPKAKLTQDLVENRNFKFIFSGNPLYRKGLDIALRAYLEEFKANEPVNLVIKLSHLPRPKKKMQYEISDLAIRLGALNSSFPKVTIINDILSDEDLAGLFGSCQAYIACGRSFYSTLPVREAIACGLPVIGPDYLSDYFQFNAEMGFPVVSEEAMIPAEKLFTGSPAVKTREVSIADLRRQMRAAFSQRNSLQDKSRNARKSIASWNTWKDLAEKVHEGILEYELKRRVK
ncbi:MAG: hypothetical protein HQM10_15865 [Candidatus Riflebacteria bacterium]|nr:hypothetical protein [Candidatus Riflebacteria bacterium]